MLKILLDRSKNNYKYRVDWDKLSIGEYFIKQRKDGLLFCRKIDEYRTENIGYVNDLFTFLHTYEDKILR